MDFGIKGRRQLAVLTRGVLAAGTFAEHAGSYGWKRRDGYLRTPS
jgi:hypothetical protein